MEEAIESAVDVVVRVLGVTGANSRARDLAGIDRHLGGQPRAPCWTEALIHGELDGVTGGVRISRPHDRHYTSAGGSKAAARPFAG